MRYTVSVNSPKTLIDAGLTSDFHDQVIACISDRCWIDEMAIQDRSTVFLKSRMFDLEFKLTIGLWQENLYVTMSIRYTTQQTRLLKLRDSFPKDETELMPNAINNILDSTETYLRERVEFGL